MTRPRWAVAARLARREVRRHPWRHALVVLLITIPVLAGFVTFSLLQSATQIQERQDQFRLSGRSGGFGEVVEIAGGAVVMADGVGNPVDPTELPDGTVVEEHWRGADWLVLERPHRSGDGPALAGVEVFEAGEGMRASDRFVVRSGRLPRSADEVLLTEPIAETGGWALGDAVESARGERTFTVVGLGVLGDSIDDAAIAVTGLPDSYWTAHIGVTESVQTASARYTNLRPQQHISAWLPDGVDDGVIDLRGGSSSGNLDRIDARVVPGITLGATAICALAAIVASAAFALASRQQLRSIGLLSTVGADPSVVRATLILQGAIPGLIAGVVAILIGAAAAWWTNATGFTERIAQVEGARVSLSVFGAILALALGTFAGAIAAWQPARTAARVPVLSALAGRRPAPPLDPRLPLTGLICWITGSILLVVAQRAGMGDEDGGFLEDAVPFLAIIATALFAFGGLGMAPLLVVTLGRLAARARGTLRLAVRGITRQRTSAADAVAAIGVALALPVGFLTAEATSNVSDSVDSPAGAIFEPESIQSSDHAVVRVGGNLRDASTQDLGDEAAAILGPTTSEISTLALSDENGDYWMVSAIDPEVASATLRPWAAEAILRGEAIPLGFAPNDQALGPESLGGSDVALRSVDQILSIPLRQPPDREPVWHEGVDQGLLVSTEVLGSFGSGRPVSGRTLVRPGKPTAREVRLLRQLDQARWASSEAPTLAQVRAAGSSETATQTTGSEGWLEIVQAYEDADPRDEFIDRMLLFLAGVSTLVAMGVLTITLSLRSYDGRDDARAALAAGAPPAQVRSVRAIEGSAIALLGALLALPLGWVPVTAVRMGQVNTAGLTSTLADRIAAPSWLVVPVLLTPAVLVAIAWLVFPVIGERLRRWRKGPTDLLAPRW